MKLANLPKPFARWQSNHWIGTFLLAIALGVFAILLFSQKPWELAARKDDLDWIDFYVGTYSWWAGLLNGVLLLGLAVTAKWWAHPSCPTKASGWLPPTPRPAWFWPLVILAMLLTLTQGLLRINQSLWDDEDTSVRLFIHGELRLKEDGSLKWRTPDWQDTLFFYRKPTNHHLQSILSRVSHDLWKSMAKPEGLRLSEPVMRIPVLGAALLSIVSLALLLRRLGFARAAVVAALLLAIHPWHVRYAIELRGYMFTLALFPLLLVLLLEALERRSWRWWIAYAFCGFCLLYANPVSFTALLVTNLAALIAILLRNHEPDGWNQLARWLVVNLVAAMLYLQLMLPCLPQLAAYLETAVSKGLLTERWHRNFYSHLYTGIPWNNSDSPLTGVPEFKWIAENSPLLFGVAFWVAGILLGIGLVRLLLKKPVGWLVVAVFVIPGLITYGFARWKGNYLYEWYLIGSLPGLLAMVALGADAIAGRFQKLHTYAPPAILLTALLAYGLSTREARGWLLEHSIQPMKESVLHIRPNLDPYDPRQKEILTVRLNAPVRSYDPHAIPMDRVATLVATLRRADESNLPLYVNYGNLHSAAVDAPLLFRMIEDDRLFEKIATLPGYDPSLERFIRKYRPGAIETYPIPDGEK